MSENTPTVNYSELHKAARRHAENGLFIFPCIPGGKAPLTENGFKDATADLTQIDAWWLETPDANIGCPLFLKDISVIDLDGEAGVNAWAMLEFEHGELETRTATTPRGGQHLYVRGALPTSQYKPGRRRCLGEHIDTRGPGSYALLPPSRTSSKVNPAYADGVYAWVDERTPLAGVPAWAVEKLRRAPSRKGQEAIEPDLPVNVCRARQRLRAYVKRGNVAVSGDGGNPATFEVFAGLSDLGISKAKGLELATDYWNPACKPPWSDTELAALAHNAWTYCQNVFGIHALKGGGREIFANQLVEWLKAEKQREKDAHKKEILSRIDFRSFADIKEERLQWLWRGRFPCGKLSLIAGLGSRGKSTILYDMAARISTGAEWPDGTGIAPQGNVILLNREDGAGDTIKPRLRAAGANMSRIVLLDSMTSEDGTKRGFSIADDLKALEVLIEHLGNVQLVVFDPLSSYFGDGVNAWREGDVRAVLEPMTQLIERLGVSVIGNTHLGKTQRQGDANMQVLNSVGIVNLARYVNMVEDEASDEPEKPDSPPGDEIRRFGPTKYNVAKRVPTLRYVIRGFNGSDEISRIDWIGTTWTRVGDHIRSDRSGRGGRKDVDRKDAEFIIRDLLANGPMRSRDLDKHCRVNDIKPRTWRRARESVSVSHKEGPEWYIALPDWEKQKAARQAKHEAQSAEARRALQLRASRDLAQGETSEDW